MRLARAVAVSTASSVLVGCGLFPDVSHLEACPSGCPEAPAGGGTAGAVGAAGAAGSPGGGGGTPGSQGGAAGTIGGAGASGKGGGSAGKAGAAGSAAQAGAAAGGTGGAGGIGGTGGGASAGASASAGAGGKAPCSGPTGADGKPSLAGVEVRVGAVAYCIDALETTVADYSAFVSYDSTSPVTQTAACTWNKTFVPGADSPSWSAFQGGDASFASYPVETVDWCDARAYCAFRGKHLCGKVGGGAVPMGSANDANVSQWYRACSHNGTRSYPFLPNFTGNPTPAMLNGVCWTGAQMNAAVVGTHPKCEGGFGSVFDMSGNVQEWEDACEPAGGTAKTDKCFLRGGTYLFKDDGSNACPTTSQQFSRDTAYKSFGIRCCWEDP